MKKIYLLIALVCLSFSNFATTWYANSGYATVLTNWWSNPTYTGTHPINFSATGDVWVINGIMDASSAWTIAGSLVLNSGNLGAYDSVSIGTMGIGGDLIMNGSSEFYSLNYNVIVTLYGNLNVTGASYWLNSDGVTNIHFANTASSLGSPQFITWAATTYPGYHTDITIDPNVTVQLLTNVFLPAFSDQPETLSGTLVCNNFSLNINVDNYFIMNNGATLYTQNPGGVDSAITGGIAHTFQNGTNFVFNGVAPQVTGASMPTSITPGGSLVFNNPAGVTLSNSTTVNDGVPLSLSAGNLTLGSSNLILAPSVVLAGIFSGACMVVTNGSGQLIQEMNTTGSYTYPVGDNAGNYTPISLNIIGGGFTPGAYVGVNVANTMQPNNANTTDYLNRYWNIVTSGISSPLYAVTNATYVPSDVTGSEADISSGLYPGALPWIKYGPANIVTHSLSSGLITATSGSFSGISTPGPTVVSSPATIICSGSSTILSAVSSTGDAPLSYAWSPSAGLSDTTGAIVSASPSATTTYTVTITDGNGFTSTDTTTVSVNPAPNIYNVTGGSGSYCAGGFGFDIGLDGSDAGFTYQLYDSSSMVGSAMAGTGSPLDFGYQTGAGVYTIYATNTTTSCMGIMAGSDTIVINPLPFADTVTGGGSYCPGGAGVDIGLNNSDTGISYQLYNGFVPMGSMMPGTGSAIDFGLQTGTGTYTVVAINLTTFCANNMAGSASVSTIPLPNVYTIGGGGSYCAGGAGVDVSLAMTDTGVNYQLYNNGSAMGSTVAGTGSMFDFGLQAAAGDYTVGAVNATTGCANNMADTAMVIINPLPNAYAVNGGGSYCPGGVGVHVGLGGSDTGISYQLYIGTTPVGSSVAGIGAAIDFGLQTTAGTYTVMATNTTTGCSSNMSDSAIVAINPPATLYTVTGGGNYCAGGIGFHIGLSGSDLGISYQLFAAGSASGSAMTGTGAAIDFGLQTIGGSYTVLATNTVTTCNTNMAGSPVIVVNALPVIYNVSGGGGYCAGGTGVHIGLTGSESGIKYQLFYGATSVAPQLAGTGSALDFGLDTGSGSYTVIAIDTTTTCTSRMAGGALVNIIPLVVPSVSITINTSDTICAGTVTTFNSNPVNTGATPTYRWTVNGISPGIDTSVYSYSPANGDTVRVWLISSAQCATPDTVMTSLTMRVLPNDTPSLRLSLNPGDTVCLGTAVTFTPVPFAGGSAPAYTWIKNGTPVSSASSYSYVPAHGDLVFVEMTSNYQCRLANTAFANVALTVDSPIVPSVSIQAFPGTTVAPGRTDTLVAIVTNGGTAPTYQWYLDNGLLPLATSNVFIATHYANNDSVTCVVTRNDVCAMQTVNSIVFTVTNVGVASLDLSGADVKILPNPNKGAFTIKGSLGVTNDEEVAIAVTDMLGQVVYTQKVNAENGVINQSVQLSSSVANGMYIVTLHTTTENKVFHIVVEQ